MDRIAETPAEQGDAEASEQHRDAPRPKVYAREWSSNHAINLRVSIPLLFGRWYVTLVAGPEKRSKQRRVEERSKHSLETGGNLMFLFSIGTISTALILLVTALVLVHGFGWSIELTIPA
ncbi:MAG: hypothetical protein OEU92_28305 [Alphaproteobacteria bacterium]|nr:hypothetical protein [Alphaproteobacteria bacterium]